MLSLMKHILVEYKSMVMNIFMSMHQTQQQKET